MKAEFWRGKRVFVTGHTGFKGAWLCQWLSQCGADVTGFALAPDTDPSLFQLLGLDRRMQSRAGDVRDLDALCQAVRGADPQIVIHMAAQAQVRAGHEDPVSTYDTNVMGTVHLLDAVRVCSGPRALVVVTSDKCYRNDGRTAGYRESDELGGNDPYSSSKACAELATHAYCASFFADGPCSVATARAGNVIGGGDWSRDRLVPDIVRAVERDEPLLLRNPSAVRPWQHVLDPLAGYLALAECLYTVGQRFAGAWNFGPAESAPVTVSRLAEEMLAAWQRNATWSVDSSDNPAEEQKLGIDISKAIAGLPWTPRLSHETAVAWTTQWYRDWSRGSSPEQLTSEQISRYEQVAA